MGSGERTEEKDEKKEGALICPLVNEQSPCGLWKLSKVAK